LGIEAILDDAIAFVSGYIGDTDDWVTVKKELLKSLPAKYRTLFSTRDPVTKRQSLNDFDRFMMEKWFRTTGTRLIFMGHNEDEKDK